MKGALKPLRRSGGVLGVPIRGEDILYELGPLALQHGVRASFLVFAQAGELHHGSNHVSISGAR